VPAPDASGWNLASVVSRVSRAREWGREVICHESRGEQRRGEESRGEEMSGQAVRSGWRWECPRACAGSRCIWVGFSRPHLPDEQGARVSREVDRGNGGGFSGLRGEVVFPDVSAVPERALLEFGPARGCDNCQRRISSRITSDHFVTASCAWPMSHRAPLMLRAPSRMTHAARPAAAPCGTPRRTICS
jgi:hypothetical protein